MSVADKSRKVIGGDHYFLQVFGILQSKFNNLFLCVIGFDQLHQLLYGRGIVKVETDHFSFQSGFFVDQMDRYGGSVGKEPDIIGIVLLDPAEQFHFQCTVLIDCFENQMGFIGSFHHRNGMHDVQHIINISIDNVVIFDKIVTVGVHLAQPNGFFLSNFPHLNPQITHQSGQAFFRHIHGIQNKSLAFVFRLKCPVGHLYGCQQQNAAAHFSGSAQNRNVL